MVNRPTPPAPRRPLITDIDQRGREPISPKSRGGRSGGTSRTGARDVADETTGEKSSRKAGSRRRVGRRVIAIVVVLVVVAGGYIAVNYASFIDGITHVNVIGGNSDDKDQNILLVGDDHRPAGATAKQLAELGTTEDGGSVDTDTIMVLHVPANGANPTLISFPRDSWVNIPGFGMHKINAAFEFGAAKGGDAGGAKLLIRVIQNLTGLTIDHYVRISLLGFYNVVNALGPVQVCLRHAVDDPYSSLHLPAGYSTITAHKALAFVRQRHGLPDGDLDREIRQQYFLSIEAHQILTAGTLLNPIKLHDVISAVSSSIQTDPGLNLLTLAAQVKGFGGHLHSTTIPILGTPTIVVNGTPVSIVQINSAAIPGFVKSIVNTTPGPAKSGTSKSGSSKSGSSTPAPTPAEISVEVQNGGGVTGAATAASSALARIGFRTGTPTTATEQSTTTVDYPASEAAAARVVGGYLPNAKLVEKSGIAEIQVVLGTDGVAVNAQSGSSTGTSKPTATAKPKPKTNTYTAGSCVN